MTTKITRDQFIDLMNRKEEIKRLKQEAAKMQQQRELEDITQFERTRARRIQKAVGW